MTTEADDGQATPPRVTRVAAYAVCTDHDAILLCRIAPGWTSDADGMWTLPGGGIDFGEAPADCAIRELEEETGLRGEITDLAGVDARSGTYPDPHDGVTREYHSIRILYRTRITGGRLRDELGGSTETCRWVPRAELGSLPIVDLVEAAVRRFSKPQRLPTARPKAEHRTRAALPASASSGEAGMPDGPLPPQSCSGEQRVTGNSPPLASPSNVRGRSWAMFPVTC